MEFKDIIGQESLKEVLNNVLVSRNISHAYIFCGEDGLGKKTMAKIFAKSILCENKNGCQCESCVLFENDTNPDFCNITREGNSIGVAEIRKMQSMAIVPPIYSDKKVFLINDAESLTKEAQNALLKILEEPQSYVVIILITNNINMLLDTIISRAVRYNFSKNTKEDIKKYIELKYGSKISNINFLVSLSDGKIGNLIKLINDEDINNIRDTVFDYVLNIKSMKISEVMDAVEFCTQNKDKVEIILSIMMMFFRDLLILKTTGDCELLTNTDKRDILIHRADGFLVKELLRNIDIVNRNINYVKRNVNFGLLLEVMFLEFQEE